MQDSIDKRNQQERVAHSIIKHWNVHYLTSAELEEKKHQEELQKAQEVMDRLNAEAAADEAAKQKEIEAAMQAAADSDYNAATKSYSGAYGKKAVTDEVTKEQINQILGEKTKAFTEHLEQTIEKHQ
ncbi:MAG: hypothetical protein IJ567_05055 [Lachnospiraceae bacterium]|nr:hypothetical protein [Lachnospiraceae bacterium]